MARYEIDKDGKRVLVEKTADPKPATPVAEKKPAAKSKSKKEDKS